MTKVYVNGQTGVNGSPVVNGRKSGDAVDINQFPVEVQAFLRPLDEQGDGMLDVEELSKAFQDFNQMKDAGKYGALYLRGLPDSVQQAIAAFDDDKSGSIQVSELARAAKMYQESQHRGRRLLKVSMALLLVIFVLMGSLAGLMYVVVEQSKETEVKGDGTMRMKGASGIVQTMNTDMHVEHGEMKDGEGEDLTMPVKAQKIPLRYTTPSELFARMDMMSVSEATYSATAKVMGVYRTHQQLVVMTPLFRVIMVNGNNLHIIQPLDDILDSATEPLPDLNALNITTNTRHLLEETGGGRKLLQAYRDVIVKLTDELADTDGADRDTVIKVRKNAKCRNMYPIGLRNNHYEYYNTDDGTKAVLKDQTKRAWCAWEGGDCDREVLDYKQCADAAKELIKLGYCSSEPALFGFRTIGLGEQGCYCIPAGQTCEPESAEYGRHQKISRNYRSNGPPEAPLSSFDYSAYQEFSREAWGYHGEGAGWNIYMVQDPTETAATAAAVEQYQDNNDINATVLTPVPEDPNIKLMYTGQVCMNVKKLYSTKDVENEQTWSQRVSKGYNRQPQYNDMFTTAYEFMTVDECMDLARKDPDCIAHGPTIQFLDYAAKSEIAYLLYDKQGIRGRLNTEWVDGVHAGYDDINFHWRKGYGYAAYHCSCSMQCTHDEIRSVDFNTGDGLETVIKKGTCRGDTFNIREYNATEEGWYMVGNGIDKPQRVAFSKYEKDSERDYAIAWTTFWVKGRMDMGDPLVTRRFPNEWHLAHFHYDVDRLWNPYTHNQIMQQPPMGHCLDKDFRYRYNDFDIAYNEYHGLGNTNIYTYTGENPFTGTDEELSTAGLPECVPVVMGTNNVGGEVRVTLPSKPYQCPTRIDKNNGVFENDDVFNLVVEEVEVDPGNAEAGIELQARAFRRGGGSDWGYELGFACCLPAMMRPEDFADSGEPSNEHKVSVGTHPSGDRWLTGLEVPEGYTCPQKVTKDNWLGGYESDREILVMQEGRSLKLYNRNCGAWDDMYLEFYCQRPAGGILPALTYSHQLEFSSSYKKTTFIADTGTQPASATKIYRINNNAKSFWIFGMTCPSVVDKSNWMVRAEDLDDLNRDQTFSVSLYKDLPTDSEDEILMSSYQDPDKIGWTIERTDTDTAIDTWDYPLAFPCKVDKCHKMVLGSSADARPGGADKWFDVPPGFTCPTTVSKLNWLSGDPYNDVFHVTQEQKGTDFNLALGSEAGSRVKVKRVDAPGAGWGMSVQFDCCVQYDCVRLNIGAQETPGDTKTFQIPDGFQCPAILDKTTWLGGYRYPDKFMLFQNKETYTYEGKEYIRWKGNDITVKRIDACEKEPTWGMDLQVDCCKPVDAEPWDEGKEVYRRIHYDWCPGC